MEPTPEKAAPKKDPPQVLHRAEGSADRDDAAELAKGKAELIRGSEEGMYSGASDEDTSDDGKPTTDELNKYSGKPNSAVEALSAAAEPEGTRDTKPVKALSALGNKEDTVSTLTELPKADTPAQYDKVEAKEAPALLKLTELESKDDNADNPVAEEER